ncbi:2'-5' RNA ligase family protein [Nocardioides anomalus]|uniref:2'-5' RNA ligase family protein n=1 Tax=Nocardioides anomalus TaxID=2712223 RepID=A0A6G6WE62_9ACTN|nr:2'-5' RNA ligase family protein [Nocardioides anomalus]QIG43618.1 2'-5' RNA ligase family protein [Nocardioides anomalus]
MSGHTVLAVPVPELDPFVRERTERYDASFVSTEPDFGHAHVTLLSPWLGAPTAADLAVVGEVVSSEPAFAYALERLEQTPLGLLMLAPEPAAPFARLTAALVAAFPQTPPYAGAFDPLPHLTLDHTETGATLAGLRAELALPVEAKAEVVQLQWWANHDCRVLHTWRLGG